MRIVFTIILSSFFSLVKAQSGSNNNLAEALSFSVGSTFGKAKILKKVDKLVLAQVTVSFKQMTTKAVQMTEKKRTLFGKSPGSSATASVTAYLETSDGELGSSDYLEITNHFYYYFQHKLKAAGIDTVGWDMVSNADLFKDNAKEKSEENEEEKSKGNSWVTYNAFNGSTMFGRSKSAAFLRMKKAGRMCEDLGGPALFINTVVDFADLDVSVNVNSGGYRSTWTPNASQTTSMKSQTKVTAYMKIPNLMENFESSFLINEKLNAESISVKDQLPAEADFATEISEDPARATKRSKFFSVSLSKKLESTPVVITTTREKYKVAAKKALEKYADAFVAKTLQMKSN
jgi:hypothetical protein